MAAAKSSTPLSRADVVGEVAAETQMPNAQVEQVIRAFENSLKRTLSSGGEVRMVGLGTFRVGERAARMGRNPKTGEALQIKASKNVRFSAGKAFKDAISGEKSDGAKVGKAKAGAAKESAAKADAKGGSKATAAKSGTAPAKATSAKVAPAKPEAKTAVPSKAEASKGGKKGGKK